MKIKSQKEWDQWYYKVYGYFYKRVNNQTIVEDLTAEVMCSAFTAKNVTNFSGYIWKVAHNYLVKYIDTKSKDPMVVSVDNDEMFAEPAYQPEWYNEEVDNTRSIQYEAKKSHILDCISDHIKPADRELIELSIVHEKNSTQISNQLNIKPATIRKKISRILAKIREKCKDIWFLPNQSNLTQNAATTQ